MRTQTHKKARRAGGVFGRSFMALTLAASMTVLPTSAGADESTSSSDATAEAISQWLDANEMSNEGGYSPYSYVSDDPTAAQSNEGAAALSSDAGASDADSATYPESFDLRTKGVVTPVKAQYPFGTCWGFADIAASEISILSEAETTYEATGLDLSERALTWFALGTTPESEGSQAGEGNTFSNEDKYPNVRYDLGGLLSYATTLFSSGSGLMLESQLPYKNEEGEITALVSKEFSGVVQSQEITGTEEELKALEEAGGTVLRKYYAALNKETDETTGKTIFHDFTWKVSDDYYGKNVLELEESYILPEYRITDADGKYVSTSQDAINATKEELQAGRGVAVSFYADQSMPSQVVQGVYIDLNTWAQYTYDDITPNHGVTIVGWDDNYSKENFGGGDATKQPPADGAWIVKNSWGADTSDFPNYGNGGWGIKDADGNSTGYFYLSYYDKNIRTPEAFDYDLNSYSESEDYLLYQYNFLNNADTLTKTSKLPTAEANVFTVDAKSLIRTVSCETTRPNTKVTYQVYVLNDGAANPTDGTLAATVEETYEYGGFHRTTFDEADWVHVAAGQSFSVVVTQYCMDDGLYYQSAAKNWKKWYDDAAVEKERQELYDKAYDDNYQQGYELYYAIYLAQGMTEDEAKAKAEASIKEIMEKDSTKELLTETTERQVAAKKGIGANAVVNEGESYTLNFAEGSSTGTWTDWYNVVTEMEAQSKYGEIYDNFPVKAYAEIDTTPDAATVTRMDGEVAENTAVSISSETFESASTVILATDRDFMDSMSATGLAGSLNAPILLVNAEGGLYSDVKAEIERLGAKKAYIIGGTNAVTENLEGQLSVMGVESERVFGNEAPDTSVVCANKIAEVNGQASTYAVVARSDNFQDALSMSSFAYKYKAAIILAPSTEGFAASALPEGGLAVLNAASDGVFVAGGAGAIADTAVTGVTATTTRLAGEDGYDTSNQVATYMVNQKLLSAETAAIANGSLAAKGMDALAGAALAGVSGGVVLLANGGTEHTDVLGAVDYTTIDEGPDSEGEKSFLAAHADITKAAYILGGTYVASNEFFNHVASVLGID